jgi:hypothetical protein
LHSFVTRNIEFTPDAGSFVGPCLLGAFWKPSRNICQFGLKPQRKSHSQTGRCSVTVRALQKEIKSGGLIAWLVGGKYLTSLNEIERMLETCRVTPSRPDSGTASQGGQNKAAVPFHFVRALHRVTARRHIHRFIQGRFQSGLHRPPFRKIRFAKARYRQPSLATIEWQVPRLCGKDARSHARERAPRPRDRQTPKGSRPPPGTRRRSIPKAPW